MGIILRYVCWSTPPPPPGGSPAVWVNGGAPDAVRARRGDLAVWPDQVAAAFASRLSLVRDILELNYCTKLFHQTVHALSAQLCNTRRNIGVSRGIHHSNKISFSIAFFAAFFRIFPHFLPIPATASPPPCVSVCSTFGLRPAWHLKHASPCGPRRHLPTDMCRTSPVRY